MLLRLQRITGCGLPLRELHAPASHDRDASSGCVCVWIRSKAPPFHWNWKERLEVGDANPVVARCIVCQSGCEGGVRKQGTNEPWCELVHAVLCGTIPPPPLSVAIMPSKLGGLDALLGSNTHTSVCIHPSLKLKTMGPRRVQPSHPCSGHATSHGPYRRLCCIPQVVYRSWTAI